MDIDRELFRLLAENEHVITLEPATFASLVMNGYATRLPDDHKGRARFAMTAKGRSQV